jgi:hypothetical protein
MLYSQTTRGFYLAGRHPNIPEDAVEITDEQHQALLDGQAAGQAIIPDSTGAPILGDHPEPEFDVLVAFTKEQVRAARAPIFASLAGMQSQALATGDTTLAASIATIQNQLKALPDLDISACKTRADLVSAFAAAWKAIVVTVPEAVLSAFKAVV